MTTVCAIVEINASCRFVDAIWICGFEFLDASDRAVCCCLAAGAQYQYMGGGRYWMSGALRRTMVVVRQ